MRLPSHTYDPKDLIRSMSVAGDGPEDVIGADDYLQPRSSTVITPESPGARPNGRLQNVRGNLLFIYDTSTVNFPCKQLNL